MGLARCQRASAHYHGPDGGGAGVGTPKTTALAKKNAKGLQGSVLSCVPSIGARFAHVGKVSGVLTQNGLEMIEAERLGHRGLLVVTGSSTLSAVDLHEQSRIHVKAKIRIAAPRLLVLDYFVALYLMLSWTVSCRAASTS
jgi:hypothetical protein